MPILLNYLRQQRKRAEMRDDFNNELDLLFTTNIGTPINPVYLVKEFQVALAATDLPRQRMQDIRHSTISFLFSLGYSEFQVQRIAGHSSHAMTTNVYGHLMPATRSGAAKDLSGLLTGAVEQARVRAQQTREGVNEGVKGDSRQSIDALLDEN